MARRGEVNSHGSARSGKELVRNLHQDPSAISRICVAAAGAAVSQVLDRHDCLDYEIVRSAAMNIRYRDDSAGIPRNRRFVATCKISVLFVQFSCSVPCDVISQRSVSTLRLPVANSDLQVMPLRFKAVSEQTMSSEPVLKTRLHFCELIYDGSVVLEPKRSKKC